MNIPDGVREIGIWAFSGCVGLRRIRIGKGVRRIGERAFYGCSGLKVIDCRIDDASGVELGRDVLKGVSKGCEVRGWVE